MSSESTSRRRLSVRWIAVASLFVTGACAHAPVAVTPSAPSAVRGALRFLEREQPDTVLGPVVVMLTPNDSAATVTRPPELREIVSSTDRFDPGFSAVAVGDFIVFVNDGTVSHRFFASGLGPDSYVAVAPGGSSDAVRVDAPAELDFYCSLHPDENFGVLVTTGVYFALLDENGRYYVGPLPGGSYRMSIWSPRVKGPIRTVQVETGRTSVETIWLDPDLIGR